MFLVEKLQLLQYEWKINNHVVYLEPLKNEVFSSDDNNKFVVIFFYVFLAFNGL